MKQIKYGSIIVDFLTIIQLISVISPEVMGPIARFYCDYQFITQVNVFSPVLALMFSCYL